MYLRLITLLTAVSIASTASAQTANSSPALTYQLPPEVIVKLVDAPPTPTISLSPEHGKDARMLLVRQSYALPTIADLAEPELRLAGLRFNPETNAPSRTRYFTSLSLQTVPAPGATPTPKQVSIVGLPAKLHALYTEWSPDGHHIAVVNIEDKTGLSLWIVTTATHTAQRVAGVRLNAVLTQPVAWIDDTSLAVLTVPAHRVAPPNKSGVPTGPVVQENDGRATPAPTYEDLLKSPQDEAVFEYNAAAQLEVLKLGATTPRALGKPGLYVSLEASPDGKYLLTEALHRPFSYTQPFERFPQKREVVDVATGTAKTLDDAPLIDNLPIDRDAVEPGPRDYGWRADAPSTIYWVKAADGGDAKKPADVRDRIYTLDAPFTGEGKAIADLALRFAGVDWGNEHLAVVTERRWRDRKTILLAIDPGNASTTKLYEGSSEDRYHDPGRPAVAINAHGNRVLQTTTDGQGLYFIGSGASPKGNMPFVGMVPVREGTKGEKRIWQSEPPYYELPVALLLTSDSVEVLARRESVEQSPNYFLNAVGAKGTMIAWTPVTSFANPYAGLKMPTHQMLHYKRADGVDLSADLYLPAGYDKSQGPLPTLMEAYPAEFKTRSAASQVVGSPYEFVRIGAGSPVFFAMTGYAVLANAAIPIIGEGNAEPNDTYTEQLVDGAKAAIDAGVANGAVDRGRVAVMGHSYGAFMTANLVAHTDLFRAGIARSGAYNRTLTPFGFQNEERTYWQAPDVYYKMSPFSYADKVKTPLLMIHGEADNNTGTFPIQSERFYNALKGHGATVRFVLLPLEAHGYQGRESVLHMLWEMQNWLDKYVKPEKPVVTQSGSATK